MHKFFLTLILLSLSAVAEASWYWPFEKDENEPPRLSEQVRKASEMIEEASDLVADGKTSDAVAKYREALVEIARVEAEYAGESEESALMGTLKTKRAYVEATIDALLLNQARENAKPVAVSDTTELERRLQEERTGVKSKSEAKAKDEGEGAKGEGEGAKDEGEGEGAKGEGAKDEAKAKGEGEGAKGEGAKEEFGSNEDGPELSMREAQTKAKPIAQAPSTKSTSTKAVSAKATSAKAMSTKAKTAKSVSAAASPTRVLSTRESIAKAIEDQDFAKADRLIDELLTKKPNDAAALSLRAMKEMAEGKVREAEKTLDSLIQSHPRDYNGYYNMAILKLQTREDDRDGARRYYETGRTLGGPIDPGIEELLK